MECEICRENVIYYIFKVSVNKHNKYKNKWIKNRKADIILDGNKNDYEKLAERLRETNVFENVCFWAEICEQTMNKYLFFC